MSSPFPSETLAISAARDRLGWTGVRARRFTTGSSFYVYDLAHSRGVAVIRMGRPEQRVALVNGLRLNAMLRPLGVPLPEILFDGTDAPLPFFAMQRLPGTDLGDVINGLAAGQRAAIAEAVADAQLATAQLLPGKGYGYTADGDTPPHACWSDVVAASLERSRRRIRENGLFAPDTADPLLDRLKDMRAALDSMPPTAFLHDTTTKNVIVAPDGRLSGIVDVDDLCYGDCRYAPALTHAAITAFGGPVDYVRPWLERMGQAADEVFQFYVALFLLDFVAEQGMAFNGNPAPSRPDERQRLLDIYQAALRVLP